VYLYFKSLCTVGEHTDWAGQYTAHNPNLAKGMVSLVSASCCHSFKSLLQLLLLGICVVCATNEGLYAHIAPFKAGYLRYDYCTKSGERGSHEFQLDVTLLASEAASGGFFSYVTGTVAVLLELGKIKPISVFNNEGSHLTDHNAGIHISNYATTLPMKKGLSSSAAICTLIAKSFNEYFKLGLSRDELMDIAYRGEIMTPSRCGRMDQCVVMGRNAIGVMEFDGSDCTLLQLSSGGSLHFVIVDLNAGKNTVKILSDLRACFPSPSTDIHVSVYEVESLCFLL
jgi:galactokinase